MIIDPPVGRYSSAEELKCWILLLEGKRVRYAEDAAALAVIQDSLAEARRWLRQVEAEA